MKSVVQINALINKGSTGKICQGIGEIAEKNGWHHFIIFGRKSNESYLRQYKVSSYWDNRLHYLESFLFDAHGLGSRRSTKKLCLWLDSIGPDIVHLHNIHGYYLNYPILLNYLNNKKVPVVWTLHDCWSFTGHCTYYSDIGCEKWKTQCETCPKTANYPKSFFLDRSRANFQLKKKLISEFKNLNFVTVSNWLKSQVKQSFLKEHSVTTIHNGVDINVFHPNYETSILDKSYHLSGKFVALAAATSWSKTKGLTDYIALSSLLQDDERIVLIGLEEKVIHQLPDNIIGLGRTENQQELARWYKRANVVLNLSSQETFGMTTAEGFACGSPGIVYNCTASPELMTEETGFIVNEGDLNSVYRSMKKIKSLGVDFFREACVKHTRINFNQELQFGKYIKLYDSLV